MIDHRFARALLASTVLLSGTSPVWAQAKGPNGEDLPYVPVETPNGATLPWTYEGEWKVFHLTLEEIDHEFAPGMVARCWGYNGRTPGPTIETVEGDKVRILVTNKIEEPTAVHWHGVLLPNGMDGVAGLTQPAIPPGETYVYEFTLRHSGTQMYHSHGDEMTQMGMGAMGFFIIHPKVPFEPKVDRDFAIFLNEWFVSPGASRPDVNVMTDFNIFTFNSRAFPGTAPLVAKTGERVRIRFGHVGQDSHAIHIHGIHMPHGAWITGTDAGRIPESAWIPETTVTILPGQTRDMEMVFVDPGDWAMHCHKRHHPMNAMGHEVPNILGVPQAGIEDRIRKLLPDYMAMGEEGMYYHAEHTKHMEGPKNTLPMMGGDGRFGCGGMGGMFTVVRIRDDLTSYADPGPYDFPAGTVAYPLGSRPAERPAGTANAVCPMHPEVKGFAGEKCPKCGMALAAPRPEAPGTARYVCPMHPEVTSDQEGKCPKCGMKLRAKE